MSNKRPSSAKRQRLRGALFARDGNDCHYCGRQLSHETATLDHAEPRKETTSDDISELVLACDDCNREKGSMTYDRFMRYREYRSHGYSMTSARWLSRISPTPDDERWARLTDAIDPLR